MSCLAQVEVKKKRYSFHTNISGQILSFFLPESTPRRFTTPSAFPSICSEDLAVAAVVPRMGYLTSASCASRHCSHRFHPKHTHIHTQTPWGFVWHLPHTPCQNRESKTPPLRATACQSAATEDPGRRNSSAERC